MIGATELDHRTVFELVDGFGSNANSFLTLYEGYRYFAPQDRVENGLIAFTESRHAWTGAAEPLAPPERIGDALRAFAAAARERGKVAMCLPVGESTRQIAEAAGYGSLKIGTEPQFALDRYEPTIDRVSTARRLWAKGARVTEWSLESLSRTRRAQLEEITRAWLGTRKLIALGFLNRVEPWTLAEHKSYFSVEHQGRTLAFVAGGPIIPVHGWYLVDLIRRPDSPPGSTELLLLESMRLLKARGARLISLGVVPLADLDPRLDTRTPGLTRALRLVYERGDLFYNFRSLHQFKLKFEPTGTEPAYLVYHPAPFGLRHARGIANAFLGTSVPRAVTRSVGQHLARFHPDSGLRQHLSSSVVMRSMPIGWKAVVGRCPFTLFLMALNVFFFALSSNAHLRLDPDWARTCAFSVPAVESGNWRSVVCSPFLHWDLPHLAINLVMLTLFCGGLEYLAGTAFMLWSYFIPALGANTLTVGLFFLPFRWIHPPWWRDLRAITDVGASLGIFGCAGALTAFFKRAPLLLGGLALGTIGYSVVSGDPLSLDHLTAAGMGLLVAHAALRSPRRVALSLEGRTRRGAPGVRPGASRMPRPAAVNPERRASARRDP